MVLIDLSSVVIVSAVHGRFLNVLVNVSNPVPRIAQNQSIGSSLDIGIVVAELSLVDVVLSVQGGICLVLANWRFVFTEFVLVIILYVK